MARRTDARPRSVRPATALTAAAVLALLCAGSLRAAPPTEDPPPAPAERPRAQAEPQPAPGAPSGQAGNQAGQQAGEKEEPRFKNLEVLPKDISRDDLFDVMRFEFVGGLGVRCSFCHVGEEGQPLSTYDFASDDKATKRKARVMMKMTREINQTFLGSLPERADPPIRVQCITCHRGLAEPRQIQDVLREALDQGGVDAAVAKYHELHDQYYGSQSYDFSDRALTGFARRLSEAGRTDDALAMLELNTREHPDYWFSYALLADLVAKSDPARAVENLKKALALAPEDSKGFVERRLEQLDKTAPATPPSPSRPEGGKEAPPPGGP